MNSNDFFSLFLEELATKKQLWNYYQFHVDPNKFLFRKAYFLQRLNYIFERVKDAKSDVLDVGCGYGTTGLFLAMNGVSVLGTTLEFYAAEIEERKKYWQEFGNTNLLRISHENLFDKSPVSKYKYIIVQDTLHHLEPIDKALEIINKSMEQDGELIVVEENGSNIIQTIKLIKQRGFKKTKYIYDEGLNKEVLVGDENIRSYEKWRNIMSRNGLTTVESTLQYVRYFLPHKFSTENYDSLLDSEQYIWQNHEFKRKYLFFGINFSALKS